MIYILALRVLYLTVKRGFVNRREPVTTIGRRMAMARVPYLDESSVAEENRELLRGAVNLSRALIHSPEAARSLRSAALFIRHRSRLDPRLRELAILQVARLSSSEYKWTQHVPIAESFGAAPETIDAIQAGRDGDPSLPEEQRAILAFTREVVEDGAAGEQAVAALRDRLGDRGVVELLLVIGNYLGLARLIATVGLEAHEPVVRLPGGTDALGPGEPA